MSFKDDIKAGVACDSVGKPDSVIGRTVCLSVHPGKMILFPLRHWYRTHYHGRYKFARAMFSLDLVLIGIAIALAAVSLYVYLFVAKPFEDNIVFEATVAPREVITGAPSTLVLRYTNGTKEELRSVQVAITPPKHFLLQESSSFSLGDIPVGESGTVHVKGVMFGDVGGEQTFKSKMTFVHGEKKDIFGQKTDAQTFKPTRSALALSLELPPRVIAYQPLEGIIRYQNNGEVAFPNVSILPHWPEGFTLTSADAKQRDGQFELPSVGVGKSGEIHFKGTLGDVKNEVTFIFDPSFTFGDERYKQETLTHVAPIVPLPIELHESITKETVRPGGEIVVTVEYKNTADFAVTDAVIGFESDSPFLKPGVVTIDAKKNSDLKKIEPGASGTVELHAKLRSTIQQTETRSYEHLTLTTRPIATYTMNDGTSSRVSSKGAALDSPITTPVVLQSFARYTAPSGDQLGRGPLPPRVGKETTYWIFWHVSGTTNELSNVRIEGTLPEGVHYTGRQTVSQNSGVEYDEATRKISWTSSSVPATLSPSSKIVGIAFEVGLTPTEAQKGTMPLLMDQIRLSATDGWTGALVSASGKMLTTNIPGDERADGKAVVK